MDETKLPPHNLEAEENVVASILIDGSLANTVALEASDFWDEGAGRCYAACKALAARGVAVDQVTVAQELDEKSSLAVVGGAAYLSHLVSGCATPLDCLYYADIVKRLSVYRKLIGAAARIEELGYAGGPDTGEVLSQADSILMSVRRTAGIVTILTPQARADLMCGRYERLYDADTGIALRTGLDDLDKQIGGGFYPGELIILAARPGLGKTTLMLNIANSVSSKRPVLFCSAEMTVEGISDRDIASTLGVPTNRIRLGGYSQDLYDRIITEGLIPIHDRLVFFYRDPPLTTAKVMQAAISMKLRDGLDLICVDYLGLLDDEFGSNQYERVGYISRKLKQMAITLDVPILVAHQLNRDVEKRDDKRPQLSDLRDSGRIEEDADLVLFLYRESYYEDHADDVAEVLVAKQRQGDAHLMVRVVYDREHQRYRDFREA